MSRCSRRPGCRNTAIHGTTAGSPSYNASPLAPRTPHLSACGRCSLRRPLLRPALRPPAAAASPYCACYSPRQATTATTSTPAASGSSQASPPSAEPLSIPLVRPLGRVLQLGSQRPVPQTLLWIWIDPAPRVHSIHRVVLALRVHQEDSGTSYGETCGPRHGHVHGWYSGRGGMVHVHGQCSGRDGT